MTVVGNLACQVGVDLNRLFGPRLCVVSHQRLHAIDHRHDASPWVAARHPAGGHVHGAGRSRPVKGGFTIRLQMRSRAGDAQRARADVLSTTPLAT